MAKVIIVEDHTLFRLGIQSALSQEPDIRIVGESGSGKELFALLKTTQADIVLLDIHLPDMDGMEISRRLREEYPEVKILIFSVENTNDILQALMEIGIDGFISKQQTTNENLAEAIRSIIDGTKYFGKDIASIMYNIYISKKHNITATTDFTQREKEIIELCKDGLQSKEIGNKLHISSRTVDTHKNNIFKKLGINNTLEMVKYALENGIIN